MPPISFFTSLRTDRIKAHQSGFLETESLLVFLGETPSSSSKLVFVTVTPVQTVPPGFLKRDVEGKARTAGSKPIGHSANSSYPRPVVTTCLNLTTARQDLIRIRWESQQLPFSRSKTSGRKENEELRCLPTFVNGRVPLPLPPLRRCDVATPARSHLFLYMDKYP